jgi:uncharacterized Ntn-hydrolase superfamily protein
MMERPTVPAAMLATFLGSASDLADRLLAALRAAEREGGDVRGRQSAAIVVGKGEAGSPPWARRFDLRVDDHCDPLGELARLVALSRAYDAMDEAEQASLRGDAEAARAAWAAGLVLAPEDDLLRLWAAAGLAQAGRGDEAREKLRLAAAVEPRAAEHLRRFAEAGHLPEADTVLQTLGIDRDVSG